MKKIGITGSLSSGKTTASKILSSRKGPLFSADLIVKKLYRKKSFKKLLQREFDIKNYFKIKSILKKKILRNNFNIKKLEKIIHPIVRKEMQKFIKRNRHKKYLFFEIPLLIESNLMNFFDIIFFIKANRKIRLKRFNLKGGEIKLFDILDKKQMKVSKKTRYCDHIIVNEKDLKILKTNLISIFKKYE